LGKDSVLLNIFDKPLTPIKFFLQLIIFGIIEYFGYLSYNHIFNFKEVWSHTYSTGGQIMDIILWPVAVVVLIIAVVIAWIAVQSFLSQSYLFIKDLPQTISHEIDVIKRIWDNRGFGKYSLFGGLSFYLRLRLRVLAYFFAFISLGIITWYLVFQQHSYEKTHWKINFYYSEPLPEFEFKANTPYTIESSVDFYGIIINGRRYITGKNTSWTEDAPNQIPLTLPKYWNITFPDTTYIEFLFYEDYINKIFSMTLEVWENKKEGMTILPSQFAYTIDKESKSNKTNKTKNKKKK
jgi:hypothetical protein